MLLEKQRKEIVEYGKKMLNSRLTESTGGNLSIFDSETGLIAIKPSSIPYDKIEPQDVVIVDKNGQIVEGKFKPSSETPMHTYLYRNRPGIRAIMHTHAPYSTALAVMKKELPIITQDLAIFASKAVHVAPFRLPGTADLGEIANKYLEDSDVVLLQNHGTLAVGESLQMTYLASWALERAAMAYCYALAIGGDYFTIPRNAAEILRKISTSDFGQKK